MQRAESREQRAESREQWKVPAGGKNHLAGGVEHRPVPGPQPQGEAPQAVKRVWTPGGR
jgi:hypothetical protein